MNRDSSKRAPVGDGTTPGVVVRGDLNGLGVVRSLTQGNVPVYVVDVSRNRPAMWARGARSVLTPALYGRPLVDTLLELRQRLGVKPTLFLTDEAAVVTVAEFGEELQEAYLFQSNPPAAVERLENKARFHEFAASVGLPIPRGAVVGKRSDCSRLASLDPPFIIKPADKSFVYSQKTERLHLAETRNQAHDICLRLVETIGEAVVQEWVPGPDRNISFCLFYQGAEKERFVAFTGRKLLATPPRVGSTAVCAPAPELHERLTAITQVFIEASNYRGLGSIEFKQDVVSGDFVIIEPTIGRTDWQEEIATLCGVNIPLWAHKAETGQERPSTSVRTDVAWRASARSWLQGDGRINGRRVYDGYWRKDDPLPAIVFYSNALFQEAAGLMRMTKSSSAGVRAFEKIKAN